MPKPSEVKNIVIHCSAGFGTKESIVKYWKEVLGWKSPGYHRLIDASGVVFELERYENYTNGVKGFNSSTIHICYIGGVEKDKAGKFIAKDTRTDKQKEVIIYCIEEVQRWLRKAGIDSSKITIKGHRDFSPDKNGNGIIESWERIKECPSFDAVKEYKHLQK